MNQYWTWGDPHVVMGQGVLADAGALWRAGASSSGTPAEVLHVLAWLHWCRYKATRGDDLINDFQAALLLFSRVGELEPELVPEELRPSLGRDVSFDQQSVGPEYWRQVGIRLLRQAEATPRVELLDQAVEIFEGTVAAYPPDRLFWPEDMKNLRYALRLRYGVERNLDDRRRSIEVSRALRRGRSPHEPLGRGVPPVPPLPNAGLPLQTGDLERLLQRVTELHDRGQHEVAEDEVRDLLVLVGPGNPAYVRLRSLLASILTTLGEVDEAQRVDPTARGRAQRSTGQQRQPKRELRSTGQRRQPKRTTKRKRQG